MNKIPAQFNYQEREASWYQYWQEQGIFESDPDERAAYTIVMPPPNVTGVLHMGHMLNNTIQDVLIRRARMKGYNALWVPGTDHASIATEAKVVAKLQAEGKSKTELGREAFLEEVWDWTHKHGGIIQDQLKRLGCSCDWRREAFTMDEERSESVLKVFVDLYREGLIYRGYRMVNWDPQARTTLSDEEVVHQEVASKLYYMRYPLVGQEGHLRVATTRPETILGDVAVCVNPDDERYQHLVGQQVTVPISGRAVPIIADEYVDREFGTGCLKITPAHDINDYTIGQKHDLEIMEVLNEDGTLNAHGLHYEGMDRFAVREKIAAELEAQGFLEKTEDYPTKVGTSERTGAVIEPRLSDQWFLRMKDLAQPALKAIMDEEPDIALIPEKFKNTYRHWMENVIDWNISRQLWWGHRIPAWYYGDGQVVVALNEEEALAQARQDSGNAHLQASDLRQDEDVLDTWFSSWLWPMSVFDGIRQPDNAEVNYYYPTRDLVTAPEILFFWVARMIMLGYHYRGERPFSHVYLTGIVRDAQGRKMSKSLGNSPDPIGLMERYSTDGVRMGMLLTSPAGNDLPFEEELCQQGRNFANKVWNAMRLVKGWDTLPSAPEPAADVAMLWLDEKLKDTVQRMEASFERYRLSEALMTLYRFVWDDFCNWYLEAIKPPYQQPISEEVRDRTLDFFEQVCALLHPFMPFVSEEIWHLLRPRAEGDSVGLGRWPNVQAPNEQLLGDFDQMLAVVNGVRHVRAQKNIPRKEALALHVPGPEALGINLFPVAQKLANLETILERGAEEGPGFTFLAGKHECYIPAAEQVDLAAEQQRLQEEIAYLEGFLQKTEKKLSNERFVQNAPAVVVDKERQKKADAADKLAALRESLGKLGG
ncbi:MAG: valine--tRNA ligase [Schleiferiaceae bacterium]|nr:valine--tRNA ligase [Schleiferiaceae bacterium]